jgi:hypothetical protein
MDVGELRDVKSALAFENADRKLYLSTTSPCSREHFELNVPTTASYTTSLRPATAFLFFLHFTFLY